MHISKKKKTTRIFGNMTGNSDDSSQGVKIQCFR